MIENGKINIYRIGEKIFVDKWKKGRKEERKKGTKSSGI